MSDLISRQDAIDAYGDWYVEEGTAEGFIGTAKQLLEVLPSAELPIKEKCYVCPHCDNCDVNDDGTIERKKGKWIPHEGCKFVGFPYMHYECSECRAFEPTKSNFCPKCGADMRGEKYVR